VAARWWVRDSRTRLSCTTNPRNRPQQRTNFPRTGDFLDGEANSPKQGMVRTRPAELNAADRHVSSAQPANARRHLASVFVVTRAGGATETSRGVAAAGACLAACMTAVLALPTRSLAFYLDADRNFSIRARAYDEAALAAEVSEPQTKPKRSPFQLIEDRHFFNPEFDANLTPHQPWPWELDNFSFRLALWGFYDGLYEYGTGQYVRPVRSIQGRISQGHTNTAAVTHTDQLINPWATYAWQYDPVLGGYAQIPFRINEAYFNVTKGPLFVRVGRQTISWGESDTVALLDANNPFNQTLAIPGVFQDIDEARIPLWTLRTEYKLFNSWGPISSAFAEAYLVPGSIDTTVSPLPLPLASPYSPPQPDPQSLLAGLIPPDINGALVKPLLGHIQVGLYDHLPTRRL